MKKLLALLCLCSAAGISTLPAQTPTVVRFHTSLGDIDAEIYENDTPATAANFLGYVDRGDYTKSFIHRSVPGFVVQGGGYFVTGSGDINLIPTQAPVVNEPRFSNVRGTLAMAKLGNDPNSATSQWFFNLTDNSANLNNQNGGFTVFGQVRNSASQAVVDAIASLQVVNAGGAFDQLPVINYRSGAVTVDNLCYVQSVTRQPAPNFFEGEVALGDGVYYLAFARTGNPFGYYSYLDNANYIYHFDLGYEYVFDARDGASGAYLYDFASNTFFYTGPTFPFPYLYDFKLRSFLYYYPDPNNPGHYNTGGVRYFYNFSTGQIITK